MTTIPLNLDNLTPDKIAALKAGDILLLSGTVYTARDAAHKLIHQAVSDGSPLPFELSGAAIYYTGPTPTRPGEVIGSCGPTSSTRMDDYTPLLLDNGLKVMIGKGQRSQAVIDAMVANKALYLAAVGGAAALIKKFITAAKVIAYPELGTEAVHKLTLNQMPVIVAIDSYGGSSVTLHPSSD